MTENDRQFRGLAPYVAAIHALVWRLSQLSSINIETKKCYGVIVRLTREAYVTN
jgi:hypothetical protein